WAQSWITSLVDTIAWIVCLWRRSVSAQGIRRGPSPRMSVLNVRRSELSVIGWRDGRNRGWRCGGGKPHQQARTVFLRSMRPRATEFGRVPRTPHLLYHDRPCPALDRLGRFLHGRAFHQGFLRFDSYLGAGIAGTPRRAPRGAVKGALARRARTARLALHHRAA